MEQPKIKIHYIDNGWLIEWKDYWLDDNGKNVIHWRQQAFTYDDNQEEVKAQKSKYKALQDMFYFIKETGLEEFYSKHNTWNLRVVLEKDAEIIDE